MGLISNILYVLSGHDAQKEIYVLKSKLATSIQKEKKAIKDKEASDDKCHNLTEQLNKEVTSKQEYKGKSDSLDAQLTEANKKKEELAKQKSNVEGQLEDLNKDVASLTSQNKAQEEEIKTLKRHLDGAEKNVASRDGGIKSLKMELANARTESLKKEDELRAKNSELERKNKEQEEKIEALLSSLTDQEAQLKEKARKAVEENKEKIKAKEEELSQKEEDLRLESDKVSSLASQLDSLKLEKSKVDGQLETAQKENTVLNGQLQELPQKQSENHIAPTDERRRLENELQKSEETVANQKSEIEKLNAELVERDGNYAKLKEAFEKSQDERNSLENQLNELLPQVEDLKKENGIIKQCLFELENNSKQETSEEEYAVTEETPSPDEKTESGKVRSTEETPNDVMEGVAVTEETSNSEDNEVTDEVGSEVPPQEAKSPKADVEKEDKDDNSGKRHVSEQTRKAILKENKAVELSNGFIEEGKDFPEIYNDSKRGALRSIRWVEDKDRNVIPADIFFDNASAEEIANRSRELSAAYMDGKIVWTCGLCHKPVKIAHKLKTLFFIHADRIGYCPWRRPAQKSQDEDLFLDFDYPETLEEKPKYQELKEKIYAALSTQESINMGISDVRMDEIMHGNTGFMKWRRPNISFVYNDRIWVIELQRRSHDTDYIVDKDKFYRLNHVQVIWVWGSDSDTSYDYMKGFNYKETLFDSHRNVFVFDKDSQEETERTNLLKLKCNWLDENNHWKYTIEDEGKNGIIIGLDKLQIDDDYSKPYYFDANKAYFEKHQLEQVAFEESHAISVDDIAKEEEKKWTEREAYQKAISDMQERVMSAQTYELNGLWGFRFNTTVLIAPIFTERPKPLKNGYFQVCKDSNYGIVNKYGQKVVEWNGIIKCDDMDYDDVYDRIIFKRTDKWGVADKKANVLVEPAYAEIQPWSETIYRVKQRQWGLCDIYNKLVLDCKFIKIGELKDGVACVRRTNPNNVLETLSGEIDENGVPKISQKIRQIDANWTIQIIGLWGLMKFDGHESIPCQYDDIEYWADNLYKVKLNRKWGVITTSDNHFVLNIEYDSIGALKENVAVVFKNGKTYKVDINGKEVASESIRLHGGLRKTRISNKWGIVNENGEEIVPHQYDEIGSFRSRLIGIINNSHVRKLNVDYNYPVYMSGHLIRNGYIVQISGIQCRLHNNSCQGKNKSDIFDEKEVCNKLVFLNISFASAIYDLRLITSEQSNKQLSHGDKKTDFADREQLTGKVTSRRKNKRGITKLLVTFPDGRKTMVPKRYFVRCHQDINYYKKDMEITLRKIGFEDEYDQTEWEIL